MNRSFALALVLAAISTAAACGGDDDDVASPVVGVDGGNDAEASTPNDSAPPLADLPAYLVPGTEAMAAITVNRSTGELFVDSSESGKIYRGMAGADQETSLELFADLTSAGITRGGHLALTPDGKSLVIASGLGDAPHLDIIDVAAKSLRKRVDIPSSGAGLPTTLQDVAVSPDGQRAYATDSFANVIHVVDLASYDATSFPISSEFPFISTVSQGFINATGLAMGNDGSSLIVVHLIDKHLYRISLAAGTLGKAQKIESDPYNVSGNGLWLGPDDELLEVGGDELRIFRFTLSADAATAKFEAKYQSDRFEQGLTHAVAHADRILVLNGSGISLSGGAPPGGGFPDAGDGGLPPVGDGGGFPPNGGDAGTKKLPIRILQLRR